MCQTSLPATRPPDDVLVWERRQGRATLLIEAGKVMNPRTREFEHRLNLRRRHIHAADLEHIVVRPA